MAYSNGISKRIRRWANVDPVWAKFLETNIHCVECGVLTERAQPEVARPNDRIYVRTGTDEQLTTLNVKCKCRRCAGQ